jgi:lipoprotein-releasing system permease protein
MVGVIGTFTGLLLGLGVAFNIDVIVPALETPAGCQFFAARCVPDQPHAQRPAAGRHLAHCHHLAGAVVCGHPVPSWRASRVNPAEALRYE